MFVTVFIFNCDTTNKGTCIQQTPILQTAHVHGWLLINDTCVHLNIQTHIHSTYQ